MHTRLALLGGIWFALAACSPSPARAPQDSPGSAVSASASSPAGSVALEARLSEAERLDIAREIADAQYPSSDVGRRIVQSMAATRMDPSRCEEFQNETRRQRCLDRIVGDAAELEDALQKAEAAQAAGREDLVTLIAEAYTDAELIGIRDFYRSPAGAAVIAKAPQINADYMTRNIPRLQAAMQRLDAPNPPPKPP